MKIWAMVTSLLLFGMMSATAAVPEMAKERNSSEHPCDTDSSTHNHMHKRRGCSPGSRRRPASSETAERRYQPLPRPPLCPPSIPLTECVAAAPLRALLLLGGPIPRERIRRCAVSARVEGLNRLRSSLVHPLPKDILLVVHAVHDAPAPGVIDAVLDHAGNVSVFAGASGIMGGASVLRRCQALEPRCTRLDSLLSVLAWLAADDRLDAYDARWLGLEAPLEGVLPREGEVPAGEEFRTSESEDIWPTQRTYLSPHLQLEQFAERFCDRGRSRNRFFELLPASAAIEEDPGPTMSPETALSLGDILPINPKHYDKNRAPKLAGQATVVYFHVTVLSLDSINEESMTYVADIFLAQSWRDPRLRLPENMSEEYRILDVEWLHDIWRPDCFFKNAKKVTFHEMSIPNHYLWLYHDKTLLYMSKLTLVLSCAMKFESYPHDTQICSMSIESLSHTVHDLVFIWNMTDPLVVNPEIELPQLDISNNYTADCTIEYSTGNFTCLAVVFNLRRRLGYHLFHSYIPSALIVIMSWISFWIKPEAIPARVTLGVTSLLTLATQNTQSQQSLPPVSYVKAIDVWMSSCSVFVFLSLMEFAVVNNYMGPVATKAMKGYSEEDIRTAVDEFKLWEHAWHILVFGITAMCVHRTSAVQQCFGGTVTFEKTTGVKFMFGDAQLLLTQPGTGITRDCSTICRSVEPCAGFTVDYQTTRCDSTSADSSGHRSRFVEAPGSNYFEKICLGGVTNLNAMCGDRLWVFERVIGAHLEGFDTRVEHNVQTKTECEKLCLLETEFTCRSADYIESQNICRLSREDRRSQPSAFKRLRDSDVDYLENQCVRSLPDCRYDVMLDNALVTMDDIQFASTQTECEIYCDQARGFTCRSYTYAADQKKCYLSGDDSISSNGAPLLIKRGAVHAEKKCSISQCENGLFTFEKVSGHFLRTAQQVGLSMLSSPGITIDCGGKCLQLGSDCPAFALDYVAQKCFKLDRNSQGRGSELSPREGQSYFEKICLRGNVQGCSGRAWAFDRRPGKELRGLDQLKIPLVQSRRDCIEYCLAEKSFDCRSAEYDTQKAECRLSEEDRRTRPMDFVDAPSHVEYLENQCLPAESRCSFEPVKDSYPRYIDLMFNVQDERDCERHCYSHTNFICRSYSFYGSRSQCILSSDDRVSVGNEAIMSRPGNTYYERICPNTQIPSPFGRPQPPPTGIGSGIGTGIGTGIGPLNPNAIVPTGTIFSRAGQPDVVNTAARCPGGYRPDFSKVTGHELSAGRGFILDRDTLPGIAVRCAQLCRAEPRCGAFNLDYTRNECTAIEGPPAAGGSIDIRPRFDLRPVPAVAFFEAVCFRSGGCGLAWSIERTINFELRGLDRVMIPGITRAECEARCVDEKSFICRSASYNYRRLECRLSTEDRWTRPQAYIASAESDYLENQCASLMAPLERCVYRNPQHDRQMVYADKATSAFADTTCQHACDVEREFLCRSYTFLSTTGLQNQQCLLSGATGITTDPTAFQIVHGAIYSERECAGPAMIVPPGYLPSAPPPSYGPTQSPPPIGPTYYPGRPLPPPLGPSALGPLGPSSTPAPFPLLPGRNASPRPQGYPPFIQPDRNFPPTGTSTGVEAYGPGLPTAPAGVVHPGGVGAEPPLPVYPCQGGTLTFEKVAGATYAPARRDALRTVRPLGVSRECLTECAKQFDRCLALSLETSRDGRQRCYALDRSSDADGGPLTAAPDLAYFQKICLSEQPCPKAWAFNRVPRYELAGTGVEIRNVFTRRQCQDECLRSRKIVCRSATYYGRDHMCKLSQETRRTQPLSFRVAAPDVDYMENECAPQPPNCEYTDSGGRFLPYTDRFIERVFDVNDCRKKCDEETEFLCRSFNFHAIRHDCFLSSDDTYAADKQALMLDRDFYYSERGSCSNVRVDCTQSDMVITFIFGAPFEGRVYATGNPRGCFEMGGGQSQIVLRIPMGTVCGTVQQGRGRYINHVVIQQNPVIMQEADKTIRVECSFDAADMTVSYGAPGTRDHDGSGGGLSVSAPFRPSGANIVTNTAPAPNVRMRIVTRAGQEAAVVGLGESLRLIIEIDPSSAFGIFARNVEARTDNGELLTLIDNTGCPRDPSIFPGLSLLNDRSKGVYADFKAFRFPSTAIVNFLATVQFCQDICEPVNCYDGVQSFGRRRRSINATDSDAFEEELHATVEEKTLEMSSTTVPSSTPLTPPTSTITLPTTNLSNIATTTRPGEMNASTQRIATEGGITNIMISSDTTTPGADTATNDTQPLIISTSTMASTTIIREVSTTSTPMSSASPSTTSTTTTTTAAPEIELPSELPLQLKLVVGEDSLPSPKKKDFLGSPVKGTNVDTEIINGETVPAPGDCHTTSLLVWTTILLLLSNGGIAAGFMMFYRSRRKKWEEPQPVGPPSYVPEVLFRNVYDRLHPKPSFSTLRNLQLST